MPPRSDRPPRPLPDVEIDPQDPGLISSGGLSLDSHDLERITLVDLPSLARYGKYELLGRIAYGGMAEIFLAREMGHEGSRRMMVVKRVLPHVAEDPHFVDMFVDEARLAMQLNHPNICHVYSFGEAEGTYYIAMEWVNGKPLSKILRHAREAGGMPIHFALKIIAQVAEALDYAHRACDSGGEPLGVVHRDVSPQNIMVSYDGVVKLLDFGIAKATSHSTRTEAGVIKGKFAYMSPQQCVGEPIDSRADIFALGICLFEALTGKNPFRRKTEFETMTKIVGDPAPRIREKRSDVPESIEEVLSVALMKQPERRYQTAGDMQIALEAALAGIGTPVNASRLGEYVSALFAADVRDGPTLDTRLSLMPGERGGSLSSLEGGASGSGEQAVDPPRPRPVDATELDALSMARHSEPAIRPRKRAGLGIAAIAGLGCVLSSLVIAGGILAWTVIDLGELDPGTLASLDPTEGEPILAPPEPWLPPSTPIAGDPLGGDPLAVDPLGAVPPDPELGVTGEHVGALPQDTLPQDTLPQNTVPSGGVEPPLPPAVGTVFVESVPPGAAISIDGRAAGVTPLEVGTIRPGMREITLRLEGHRPFTRRVRVESGGRVTVTGELARQEPRRPTAEGGTLSLNTRPWSKVYLGRRLLGTTPLGDVEVPSGTQRLRLVDRDGTEHERSIRIPPGEHISESFNLQE